MPMSLNAQYPPVSCGFIQQHRRAQVRRLRLPIRPGQRRYSERQYAGSSKTPGGGAKAGRRAAAPQRRRPERVRYVKAAGGKEIEIYIQDIYPHWPYDGLGMADYLAKVDGVVKQVMASPNRSLFSYVPFNEPDQIWYNKSDKKQALFDDWKTVYQRIKALDPAARIVGPNFAHYDSAVYRDFRPSPGTTPACPT